MRLQVESFVDHLLVELGELLVPRRVLRKLGRHRSLNQIADANLFASTEFFDRITDLVRLLDLRHTRQ